MTAFESTPRKSQMRRRQGGGDNIGDDDGGGEDDDGKELAMDHLTYERVQV